MSSTTSLNNNKPNSSSFSVFIQIFCTFFYVGKLQKMPGTWGTIAAIPLFWLMSFLSLEIYMLSTVALVFFSIWACQHFERITQSHDSSEIVIDEVAGFLITMAALPFSLWSVLLGFALFRILDISKPLFIGLIDKKAPGGFGVMADDIAAGIVANMILQFVGIQWGLW